MKGSRPARGREEKGGMRYSKIPLFVLVPFYLFIILGLKFERIGTIIKFNQSQENTDYSIIRQTAHFASLWLHKEILIKKIQFKDIIPVN